jgi:predicted TIM-barrel fold metal-dependent hydrolase
MSDQAIIPEQLEAPRMPSVPRARLPAFSCDTHCHVFGPYERYPLRHPSSYAAPDAPAERYLEMLDTVGMGRGVLVQPAPYGTDPSALLAAVARRPAALRGIAVAEAGTGLAALQALYAGGIRGLRFVEARDKSGRLLQGSVGFDSIAPLASAMAQAGLHAQVWGPRETQLAHLERLADLGIPVVVDHMACLSPQLGLDDALMQLLLRLLRAGRIWLKLSVCRVSRAAPDYAELRPLHDALLAANPDRMLWGSDWPYVRMGADAPDVAALIDLAWRWFGDDPTRHKVWVDNPAALYGFKE